MSDENKEERNPVFALKDLRVQDKVKMKLDCSKAIKTGDTKYGTWYLWFASVEDARVRYGKGASQKIEDGYTGKVIFFPSEKLNNELEKLTNGNTEVDVEITKTEERGFSKAITRYVVKKLSDGVQDANALKPTEATLIKEAKELKDDGYEFTEELFIKASKEPQYGGKISEDRAKEIFKLL